jgi:hypothetical protein
MKGVGRGAGTPTNFPTGMGSERMAGIIEVRRTYKYRLYRSRHDRHLHDTINIAGIIWNHLTALQKRYYRLFGKHISEGWMKKHVATLRRRTARFAHWQKVGSQAVQDICERHEKAYQRFFSFEDLSLDGMRRLWGRKVGNRLAARGNQRLPSVGQRPTPGVSQSMEASASAEHPAFTADAPRF